MMREQLSVLFHSNFVEMTFASAPDLLHSFGCVVVY